MDQACFAGVGNIYRCEILLIAAVHPNVPGNQVCVCARARVHVCVRVCMWVGGCACVMQDKHCTYIRVHPHQPVTYYRNLYVLILTILTHMHMHMHMHMLNRSSRGSSSTACGRRPCVFFRRASRWAQLSRSSPRKHRRCVDRPPPCSQRTNH